MKVRLVLNFEAFMELEKNERVKERFNQKVNNSDDPE